MSKKLSGLDEVICDLDGNPLTNKGAPIRIKNILANSLARGSSKEPVKVMSLALGIYEAKKEVVIDDADLAEITLAVKEDVTINNIAKAAGLECLIQAQIDSQSRNPKPGK